MTHLTALCHRINDGIPTRLNIGILSCLITFTSYVLRANIVLSMLAMVNPTNSNVTAPDYGPRYDWTSTQQGLILGGFFWGCFMSTLPLSFLGEWFGSKPVTTIALVISTILTILTPKMCEHSFGAIFMNRVILGIVNGAFFPALHTMLSKWAPPVEKGRFVAALLGGGLGTVITWQFTGIIIMEYGWVYVYYGIGILTLFITIAWTYLVSNDPDSHPRISEKELKHIKESLGDTLSKSQAVPPYRRILTSIPFIALLLLHFGSMWGLSFLMTAAPKYMMEVLQFNLASAGILASLPHLSRFLAGFIFGYIGDRIRQRKCIPLTMTRKLFCIFSHIVPGLLLISLTYVGDNPFICVALITASLGSNGAATQTNLQNSQDLAPNFAGSLYSIINFIGLSTGFITPLVVSYFTQEQSTKNEWNYVFWIGGIIYIVPVLLYWMFGTAEVQPWNEIQEKEADANKTNEA